MGRVRPCASGNSLLSTQVSHDYYRGRAAPGRYRCLWYMLIGLITASTVLRVGSSTELSTFRRLASQRCAFLIPSGFARHRAYFLPTSRDRAYIEEVEPKHCDLCSDDTTPFSVQISACTIRSGPNGVKQPDRRFEQCRLVYALYFILRRSFRSRNKSIYDGRFKADARLMRGGLKGE